MLPIPDPLPYHRAIVEHLRAEEPGLWKWFATTRSRANDAEAVRLDLLKSTYRLDALSEPKLHRLSDEIRDRMGLKCTVTLYQAQTGSVLNAALAYLPNEAHIILHGPLASVLADNEMRAVLAHELAHYHLFEASEGNYLIANDLVRALSSDPVAGAVAMESLRLYSLWTEIYADRWACHVNEDLTATVAALIKIETGLNEVSAESYLRQADEIFAKSSVQADQFSHPEPFIRARALRLWSEQSDAAQPEIERMIEGNLQLQRLDMLGQKHAAKLTRQFLQSLLKPAWFITEAVQGHAKRFFPDFTTDAAADDTEIKIELEGGDPSLTDYLCYLLLDFVTVDRDLGDVALAAAIVRSRDLGFDKRFIEIAQKELTLTKKAFAKTVKDADSILTKTEAAHSK